MSATGRSSPASARRKASSASSRACGNDYAIARGLAYAPYCRPAVVGDQRARTWRRPSASPTRSTGSSRARCWPTTARPASTGRRSCRPEEIAAFQREIGKMGYRFQFVTLAGFHSLNLSMFNLARGYRERGMAAYSRAAAGRVRGRGRGLHRDPPSARSRRRLFRRGGDGDLGRQVVHDGAGRVSTEAAQFHDDGAGGRGARRS